MYIENFATNFTTKKIGTNLNKYGKIGWVALSDLKQSIVLLIYVRPTVFSLLNSG